MAGKSNLVPEYDVVYDNELDDLIEEVNDNLMKGWKVVGGIHSDEEYWYQAMLKVVLEEESGAKS